MSQSLEYGIDDSFGSIQAVHQAIQRGAVSMCICFKGQPFGDFKHGCGVAKCILDRHTVTDCK